MRFFKVLVLLFLCIGPFALAQETTKDPFHVTDLPLPRFASLGSSHIYVRTGPGTLYPVRWEYRRRGLPVEIVLEFDHWRKIQDAEGQGGWVHKSMLSGRRSAVVIESSPPFLRRAPDALAYPVAQVEKGTLLILKDCGATWCKAEVGDYAGWIEKKSLWGVYACEKLD